MAKYLCMGSPLPEANVSEEEMQSLKQQVNSNPEICDVLRLIEICQGDLSATLEKVAQDTGMGLSSLIAEVDKTCRSILCDKDISDSIPQLASEITRLLLTGTCIAKPYVGVVAFCVAILIKKGIRSYAG